MINPLHPLVALRIFFLSLVLPEIIPGDHGEEATPVPIPNTVVKLLIADGTAIIRVVGE